MAAGFCSRARERLPSMQLATGDSVTRTPLVCATRVAVLNVSIVRSRGPRGGMSNDLILASEQTKPEARPTIRAFLALPLSNLFRNDTRRLDSSFFPTFENNQTRSWHSLPSDVPAVPSGSLGFPRFLAISFASRRIQRGIAVGRLIGTGNMAKMDVSVIGIGWRDW